MKNSHTITKSLVYILLYLITGGIIISLLLGTPNEQNPHPLFRQFIIIFATVLLTKYFIYMTVSPWYDVSLKWKRRNKQQALAGKSYHPRVSVIVPAWNEEVGILNTIKTILASTYRNMEIIVINDGSIDGSHVLMRNFLNEYEQRTPIDDKKIDIIYRYRINGGKGKALNEGILISTGDIIVSVDADCALRPDTIANFVRHFEDPTVMAAVGNVKIGNTQSILGTLQYLEFLFSFYFKKADSLFNAIYIIGGAAGAFRRKVFEQIGLYNHHNITEDIDLSVRIQDAGMRIVYAADAIVYTEGATTLEGLMKQRLRWKRGRFKTFSDHRHLFFSAKPHHNRILTWVVLPLAIFGDMQLFFEVIFLGFLYIYSLTTHDFSSFISGIMVVSSMFFVQIFDDRSARRWSLYILAPIGWLLFYLTTFVEYHALIKSIWGLLTGQKIEWQRWKRAGCLTDKTVLQIK